MARLILRLLAFTLSTVSPGHCTGEFPGDVQLVGGNRSEGRGELQFQGEDGAWADICSGAIDVIDAQIACQDLGFSFLSAITTVTDPAQADSSFSITLIDCFTQLEQHSSGISAALTQTSMNHCPYDYAINEPCVSTVYLECKNISVEDNALLVFTPYLRLFLVIAPGIPLLTDCRSEQFYCETTIVVPQSALFFSVFRPGQICGTINMTYFFNIVCTPKEGDVCLLQSLSSCRGAGLVTFVRDARQLGVCMESFGFIEAYVVCRKLGLARIQTLSHAPLSDYSLPADTISANCNGTETDFSSCLIQEISNCSEVAQLVCGFGDILGEFKVYSDVKLSVDDVLVGVSADPSAPFAVISPTDGVYVDDCHASRPLCPGVYYMDRTLPTLQNIITRLQVSQSCSQLGLIDLNIPCSLGSTISNNNEVMMTPFPTPTTSKSDGNINALAGLSVLPILLLTFIGGIAVYICYRRQQKRQVREIMEELQTLHSLNNTHNEYARPSLTTMRPHRSVNAHRMSNTSDGSRYDMKIPFACLTLDKMIGSGAYGSIYHGVIACEHQAEPIEVAVKVLKNMPTASEQRSLQLEIDMMKELGYHRHLVTMLAWSMEGNKLALVMEYICGGNLHDFLRSHRNKALMLVEEEDKDDGGESRDDIKFRGDTDHNRSDQELVIQGDEILSFGGSLTLTNQLQFARQITLGMEYLASKKIVHRDLAARNILVGEDQILKLADFGLSRGIKDSNGYYMKGVEDRLPVRWMAVESILDREFTLMSDVWAFGVVLWEIMTYAAFPFHHLSNREVISSVKAGRRMAQPEGCPDKVYGIMLQCWRTDPLQRPLIRNVRTMLDGLLDTGGYIHLLDDATLADKLFHVHCSGKKTVQQSLPFKKSTAFNPAGRHQSM